MPTIKKTETAPRTPNDNQLTLSRPGDELIFTTSGPVINAKGEIVKKPETQKGVAKTKKTK